MKGPELVLSRCYITLLTNRCMCPSFGAFSLLDTATMSLREARSSSLHREAIDTSMPDQLLDLIMREARFGCRLILSCFMFS